MAKPGKQPSRKAQKQESNKTQETKKDGKRQIRKKKERALKEKERKKEKEEKEALDYEKHRIHYEKTQTLQELRDWQRKHWSILLFISGKYELEDEEEWKKFRPEAKFMTEKSLAETLEFYSDPDFQFECTEEEFFGEGPPTDSDTETEIENILRHIKKVRFGPPYYFHEFPFHKFSPSSSFPLPLLQNQT